MSTAYRFRRNKEIKELAIAMSYSHHAPDKIEENMVDPTELMDKAEAAGFDTDTTQYWGD